MFSCNGRRRSSMAVLYPFLLMLLSSLVHAVDIRMVDGVERNPTPPASEAQEGAYQARKRDPREATGPPLLVALRDACFSTVEGNYDYTVCLFANVTQRRVNDRLRVGLGVWDRWDVAMNGSQMTFVMKYNDGDICIGETSRSADIRVICGADDLTVSNIKEPKTCQYAAELRLPLPCSALEQSVGAELLAQQSIVDDLSLEVDVLGRGEERGKGFRFLGGLLANLGNRGDDGNKGNGRRRGAAGSSDTQSCPADNALSPPCHRAGCAEQEAVTATLATLMQEVSSLRRQFTKFAEEERTALAELRALVVEHVHVNLPQAGA